MAAPPPPRPVTESQTKTVSQRATVVPPKTAELVVPGWMWGGDPAGYFATARLHARHSEQPERWRVQTAERYRGQRPSLVRVDHLAGPATRRPQIDLLAAAAAAPDAILADTGGQLPRQLEELRELANHSGLLVDGWSSWLAATSLAPVDRLVEVVEAVYDGMREMPLEGDAAVRLHADAGVQLVRRDPVVVHRAKLASTLLQTEHDPALQNGEMADLKARLAAGPVLVSSQGLFEGIFLFDAYLGPLLGALAPHVWAFSAPRALGVVAYTLGCALNGTLGRAAELLQLLPGQRPIESVPYPQISGEAAAAALDWWVARLNELFGVLTDPAVFTDNTGRYHPAKHLHALLSVEQLLRRVGSIQTSDRDAVSRRVLLFTVADTLTRLTGRSLERLCSLRFARRCLDRLEGQIPTAAIPILLPAARRAVAALEALPAGFGSRGPDGSTIVIPRADGANDTLDPERAAARYVVLLRNATHGHGAKSSGDAPATNALLAHHNGHLPRDLPLLGYLYLLDLLNRPDDLARGLFSGGAV